MKIVMIGPVYPFKTGLSYYVTLLYKQLVKKHDVKLLSYTMQYPKVLYKKPQKDYEDKALKIEEVTYMLNTASPISCWKTAKYINEFRPDLVIFQWLHPYFAPCYTLISKMIKNSKILFMCHNVFPHERFPLDRLLTKVTLRNADFFTVHAQTDAEDLKTIIPDAKMAVTVHPAYDFFKQRDISKEDARNELNIDKDDVVLLFFGLVRDYKGLKHLINALNEIKRTDPNNTRRIKLLVAGDFAGRRCEYDDMISNFGLEDMIDITDGHIPIDEVEKFFSAADMVVLPYESATQSGVIQVAYSFNKPVLATRVGGLPDVVFDGVTGYLVEPFRPDLIAAAISDFVDNDKAQEFAEGIEREKYRYSWEKMEEVIINLI